MNAPRSLPMELVLRRYEVFVGHIRFPEDFAHGCWAWDGPSKHGYGIMNMYKRLSPYQAHRVSHVLWLGPIPHGFQVDHTCRNTLCVSPFHLQAVPGEENLRRRVFSPVITERPRRAVTLATLLAMHEEGP